MLKQAFLLLLARWNSKHVRPEHASVEIKIPLDPLLVACETPGHWSVLDARICRTAESAYIGYRPLDDSRRMSFDVMPDVCGVDMEIEPYEYANSWGVTFEKLWRRANYGWNMSTPIQEAVFRGGEGWNEVSIRGDWIQVLRTLECLEGIGATITRTWTMDLGVHERRSCSPFEFAPTPTLEDVNRTAVALLAAMSRLSSLRTLRISIPDIYSQWFATILSPNNTVQAPLLNETDRDTNYTITNAITSLSLDPFTHPLLYYTPHVRNITLHNWDLLEPPWVPPPPEDALVTTIVRSGVPVQHLELYRISPETLARIANAIPGLKSLELGNYSLDCGGDAVYFENLLPSLQQFTNITTLSLPPIHAIDPDCDTPWCGTAYLNCPGLGDEVNGQYDVSVRRFVDLVKERLPAVGRVRFGTSGAWLDLR